MTPAKLWITDFGLARIEADAGMTMTGDLLGTLRYMSPEQALAKRVVVDHRSDIYSLGVTLYELLTLQPAFTGDDRQELLRQIAFDEPRSRGRSIASIPQDLETIVLKAIEKNPADRYATAHDLAADLQPVSAASTDQGKTAWSERSACEVVAPPPRRLESYAACATGVWNRRGRDHWLGGARSASAAGFG